MSSVAIALCLLASTSLQAQPIVDHGERLDADRPEAWAMGYMSAAMLFSGYAPPSERPPGSVSLGVELGHVPRLSEHKRRVGFDGTKLEDLNKTPVFGALRAELRLPHGFGLEASWTPPLRLNGASPGALGGVAVDRVLVDGDAWRVGARLFHQRGTVSGDFTCDRETASFPAGSAQNPFGCRRPSRDRFDLEQTGLELAVSRRVRDGAFEPHLSYSITDSRPGTRVRAETFGVRDRSHLTTRLTLHTFMLGTTYRPVDGWELSATMAWTPLDARRGPDNRRSTHDLWSTRLMLRYWVR